MVIESPNNFGKFALFLILEDFPAIAYHGSSRTKKLAKLGILSKSAGLNMTIHLPDSLQSFLQQRVQEEAHKNLEEYIVKLVEGDRDRVQSGHLQDFLAQVSKDSNISEASSERKQELEKLILYRVRAESLEVLHFLHGSRDIAQVLDDS